LVINIKSLATCLGSQNNPQANSHNTVLSLYGYNRASVISVTSLSN